MAYLDENGLEHFWGKIKDHVDSAVAPKANDADVLHKTGTEAISGEKVFSGIQTTALGNETALMVIKDATLVKGETPATNHFLSLGFIDSTGDSYAQDTASRLAVMEYKSPSEADSKSFMQMADIGFNGGGTAFLRVGHDKDNIPYSTAPATSDDRTDSTDIVTRGYMEASEWNWQKTKKAGAVAFKPVPESDLEPVVDFVFTETPPAEGEKGPENPSTITGVTQVKVTMCGKNLLSQDFNGNTVPSGETVEFRGITYVNSNGTYAISGTASSGNSVCLISGNKELYLHPGTYYLSGFNLPSGGPAVNIQILNNDGTVKSTIGSFKTAAVITVTDDTQGWANIYFRCENGTSYPEGYTCSPQLELGSVATAFEPGVSTVFTISLGDTYYGGSLDVATGVMTVTWAGDILSASNFSTVGSSQSVVTTMVFNTSLAHGGGSATSSSVLTCNRFPTVSGSEDIEHCRFSGSGSGTALNIYIDRSRLDLSGAVDPANPTSAELKTALFAWLETNQTLVVYQPSEPFTVQLTPTQIRSLPALDKYEPRINTVYTDQEAVQVGYQRYAGGAVKALGTTAARTLPERFADVVNVRDFGAVGDGSTNDTAAVRNADAAASVAGKTVYFPDGLYVISDVDAYAAWDMSVGAKLLQLPGTTRPVVTFYASEKHHGHICIDSQNNECIGMLRSYGDNCVFDSIHLMNLTGNEVLSRGTHIGCSCSVFKEIRLDNFVNTGFDNDSVPQGVCLSSYQDNPADGNNFHLIVANNCRATVCVNSTGENHYGSVLSYNAKDNGFYAFTEGGGVSVIDSLYYDGDDAVLGVRHGSSVYVNSVEVIRVGSNALFFGNIKDVFIDTIYSNIEGYTLLAIENTLEDETLTTNGNITINNIFGKIGTLAYFPDTKHDLRQKIGCLTINNIDASSYQDVSSATNTVTEYSFMDLRCCDEYHLGKIRLNIFVKGSVTYNISCPMPNPVLKNSSIDKVVFRFYDYDTKELRNSGDAFFIRSAAQEKVFCRSGVIRYDGGQLMINNVIPEYEDLRASEIPVNGTYRTGQILWDTAPANGIAGFICISGGTPGTWGTISYS